MAGNKTFTELTTLATVDKDNDWMAVVDVSDTSASVYGTTKKAVVNQFIGPTGAAATVDAGTTTTGAEGTNASVVNVGTTSAAVFNFTIPRGNTGATGATGADGDSAYVYIAYASDSNGTGFTTTFNPNLDYIAIKTTTVAIPTPSVSDFTGLWKNYKGSQGIQGETGLTGEAGADGNSAYVYIAYASDASGTDFTTTFNASLDYVAIKTTTSPIASPQASDFVGLWKNYKGQKGDKGDKGDKGNTGLTGPAGADGVDGEDAYVYIAYASDASGTGFTTTFNANLDYIAIKSTTTPIATPQASDFTGLWKKYKGIQGEQGVAGEDGSSAYVYIAYASDANGTGFTTTFDASLDYIAIKATTSPIASPQASDFTGLWKNYKGEKGNKGDTGATGPAGADGLDITWKGTYSSGTAYVVNDAVFYEGSSYICILNSTGNLPTNTTYWNLMAQKGAAGEGSGDVSGPSSSTDNAVARFDSVTGKLIQNSLVTIDDSGSVNIPAGQNYLVNGTPVSGYSDEQAQDAVAGMIADTDTVDFTYTDATPELKADVKDASITNAKLANMATKTYKGRTSATTGSPEDVSVATLKTDLALTKADVGLENVDNAQQIPSSYLDTDGALTANSDTKVASQKATKTYADTKLAKATNVTAINDTGIADGEIAVFNLTNKDIRTSDKTITTSLGADDTTLPTSKAVADAISASGGYTDENAQDAVGTILTDTTTIDLTYTDDTPSIKADVKSASLTTSHLASGVLDTDLTSVSASNDTLPSAKATKTYVDSTKFTWRGAWATTTAYAVNDTVQQGGSGYVCVTAHTSGTFSTDLSGGKWNLLVEGLPTPNLTTSTTTNLTGVITGNGSVLASKANPSGAIVGTTDTQTLTNKTIDGNNNTLKHIIPAGSITMYGGSTAPTGYLLCDGSAVSRTTYADLFTAIGTTYGAGDGSTTFNVPNVKGKVPVGRDSGDTSFDTLGETGGVKEVTLTSAQSGLPAHTHPTQTYLIPSGNGSYTTGTYAINAGSGTGENTAQNASQAHTNLQPYIVFNYIIKT